MADTYSRPQLPFAMNPFDYPPSSSSSYQGTYDSNPAGSHPIASTSSRSPPHHSQLPYSSSFSSASYSPPGFGSQPAPRSWSSQAGDPAWPYSVSYPAEHLSPSHDLPDNSQHNFGSMGGMSNRLQSPLNSPDERRSNIALSPEVQRPPNQPVQVPVVTNLPFAKLLDSYNDVLAIAKGLGSSTSPDLTALTQMLAGASEGAQILSASTTKSSPNKRQRTGSISPTVSRRKRTPSRSEDSTAENQLCKGCFAASTPEWRRGPMGPRTLCNACGLVYAKLLKRRSKDKRQPRPTAPTNAALKGAGSSTSGLASSAARITHAQRASRLPSEGDTDGEDEMVGDSAIVQRDSTMSMKR